MLKMSQSFIAALFVAGCGVSPDMAPMAWQTAAKDSPVTVYGVTYCLNLLDQWDRDHDAALDETEYVDGHVYAPSLEDPPEEQMEEIARSAQERFAFLDRSRDGRLDAVELFPEYWNMPKPKVRPDSSAKVLRAALKESVGRFVALDRNESGYLHQEEFGITKAARQRFRKLDLNQDHVLYLGEYLPEHETLR